MKQETLRFPQQSLNMTLKTAESQHDETVKPTGQEKLQRLLKATNHRIIQPILLYCSSCFFNMLSVKNWAKLTHITNTAAKIIGHPTTNLTELNNTAPTCIATSTEQDITHGFDTTLLSGQSTEVQSGLFWEKPDTHSQICFQK